MKRYSNLFHIHLLAYKYHIKILEIGYLYGKLQYKTSMINFEFIIKDYKKSIINNTFDDFKNKIEFTYNIRI